MAEVKDYLGLLVEQDKNVPAVTYYKSGDENDPFSKTPQQFLEELKQRLVDLGATPGTGEYQDAFMSYVNRVSLDKQGLAKQSAAGFSPTSAQQAMEYLNNKLKYDDIKKLGVEALNWQIGTDTKGGWRSKSGEFISNKDIYQRDQMGEKEVDPKTGLPLYGALAPFATVSAGPDVGGQLKLEDLDIVPESAFWYLKAEYNKREDAAGNITNYERDIPQELIDMGFVPGAKVTPELVEKYRQYQLSRMNPELYSKITGQPFAPGYNLQGVYVGVDAVDAAGNPIDGTSGTGNSNTFNAPGTPGYNAGRPTTNTDVLKAALRGLGFKSAILDSSTSFLTGLLRDGLDYDNATEVFLNNKEYTLKNGVKMTSPFYTEYGYLNEGLVVPKSASDLFNTVEGYKGVIDKYKLSSKYLTKDSLQKYLKNDVTVKDLSDRAASAELRALEADQFQVNALVKLGYIGSATDLKDFYMDSKIGQEQLELNRQTGVFTAEALRRAKSGVLSSDNQLSQFKQLTASLAAKGYSEAQISQLAGTGFENIAEAINPMTKFAQVYDKAGGTVESNAALTESLQTELLSEEFKGTASEKRKRYSELERSAFQGSSGRANVRPSSVAGIL